MGRGGEIREGGSCMTLLYNEEDDIDEYEDAIGEMTNATAMYSSFLAHPEADGSTLDALHSTLYGMINFIFFVAPPNDCEMPLPYVPPQPSL